MLQHTTRPMEGKPEEMVAPQVERAAQGIALLSQWRLLTYILVTHDIVMVGSAFLLAYVVRFQVDVVLFRDDVFSSYGYYRALSLILVPVWILIFAAVGLYKRNNLLGGTEEYSLILRATSFGILALVIVSFLFPDFILARGWLLLAWVLAFLLVGFGRFLVRRIAYALRRRGYLLTPAVIVGANGEGRALAQQLITWQTSGLHVVGFVDDTIQAGARIYKHLGCLGDTSQLGELISQHKVGEVVLSSSALSQEDILRMFKQYGLKKGVNLHLSSGLFEIITTGMDVSEFAYVPLVRVRRVRLTGADRALKLLLDYFFTIPGLIAISPLLLIIALAIKLDSPGPIIYRRRVMGLNGQQFDAYKFRTMYVDGDEILARYPELQRAFVQEYKLKKDPRITRMGNWLRKTSLDELPQLLNVLKRDMSLVGPRIIAPVEMEKYGEWGLNLLTVPPGITGLWQVSGRSDLSYEERVRLDMHYIRNWTIWSDLQIMWQTIPAVLQGRGAY